MTRVLSRALIAAALLAAGVPRVASLAQRPVAPHLWHVDIGLNFFYGGVLVNAFFPATLIIHTGDSVQFTNQTPLRPQTVTFGPILDTPPLITRADLTEINPQVVAPHGGSVVSDASSTVYSSGALMTGIHGLSTTYTFTFPHTGTYFYRSLFHPQSLAKLIVVGPGQPVSSDPPDSGPGFREVVRSIDKTINSLRAAQREGGSNIGAIRVEIGGGDGNISLNTFSPEGVHVSVGGSVTWLITETSGDPHAIMLGGGAPSTSPYVGLAPDGGLLFNPIVARPTLASNTTVMTGTIKPTSSSGILYGSSVAYPSSAPAKYVLTFDVPGLYYVIDPFGGSRGAPIVRVE